MSTSANFNSRMAILQIAWEQFLYDAKYLLLFSNLNLENVKFSSPKEMARLDMLPLNSKFKELPTFRFNIERVNITYVRKWNAKVAIRLSSALAVKEGFRFLIALMKLNKTIGKKNVRNKSAMPKILKTFCCLLLFLQLS